MPGKCHLLGLYKSRSGAMFSVRFAAQIESFSDERFSFLFQEKEKLPGKILFLWVSMNLIPKYINKDDKFISLIFSCIKIVVKFAKGKIPSLRRWTYSLDRKIIHFVGLSACVLMTQAKFRMRTEKCSVRQTWQAQ